MLATGAVAALAPPRTDIQANPPFVIPSLIAARRSSNASADAVTQKKAGIAAGLSISRQCPKAQAALASASEPSAALTISTTAVNEAASSMAIAERVLRSSSMPALCRPLMNIE